MNLFKYFSRIGTYECTLFEVKEISESIVFKTANVIQYTLFGQTVQRIYCTCDSHRYVSDQWYDEDGVELDNEVRWAINAFVSIRDNEAYRLQAKEQIAKYRAI